MFTSRPDGPWALDAQPPRSKETVMFRKSNLLKSNLLAITLGVAAIASMAAQPAHAAEVGARVYLQPWIPEAAAQDQVQTSYDNASVVSDAVKKAWSASKLAVRTGICT